MNVASACGCVKGGVIGLIRRCELWFPYDCSPRWWDCSSPINGFMLGGCVTEARWASQNDEVYDRELVN